MILKIDPRPLFLCWTPGHNDCVWTLVHLHYTSQFHTFQGNHQSLQWNVCAAHVNNFSSNLVECIDFSGLSGATVGWSRFFRINNIQLKCSFVQCRKYHKSWWNGAAELHISVDLLCGTTDAELHNSPVNLLCGTTDAELNNPVWCMHQESHAFSKEKYEGLIQSKISLSVWTFSKLLKDERFGRFIKHRSIIDLRQTLEICVALRRFSTLLKERFASRDLDFWHSQKM